MTTFQPPAFILDEAKLKANLEIIGSIAAEAGVQVIPALKSFALWPVFPMIRPYVSGASASSLHEVLLINREMGVKAHTYAPAYLPYEFEDVLRHSSHLIFNSLNQYTAYAAAVSQWREEVHFGLRVNPGYSEVKVATYNPCAPGSRLGMTAEQLPEQLPEGLTGLHFHALCESGFAELSRLVAHFESQFAGHLEQVSWVNFGGGHLVTREDYDRASLIHLLQDFQEKHQVTVILEPGSAFVWETGVLAATVLDIVTANGIRTAILDVSFKAHMPDTLEMPYRPRITGMSEDGQGRYVYRMGGLSCLSGDFVGDYYFDRPLQVGQRLFLEDMMHYTLVHTTFFNGVRHPDICIRRENGTLEVLRTFDYGDFRARMG